MRKRLAALGAVLSALTVPAGEAGATTVTQPTNAGDAARLLVGAPASGDIAGNGVEVISAAFVRADGSANPSVNATGLFSGAPAGLGFSNGVGLSTGEAKILLKASDPGYLAGWSVDNADSPPPADWFAANGNAFPQVPGDPTPTSYTAYDSVMLQLTLRPSGNTLALDWLFGSEEFGGMGGPDPQYSDMALILVDSTASGNPADKNCARLPPDDRPTSVSLVDTTAAYFRSDAGAALSSLYGLTTPQTCRVNVVPGETVTIRATVFDVGDSTNDAALVLGAGSLRSDVPPTPALAATPPGGTAPLAVTFSTAGTSDDSAIASWQLDFGDGQSTSGAGAPPAEVQHQYTGAGDYTATLSVTDDTGQQRSASTPVSVTAPATTSGGPTPGDGTAPPPAAPGPPATSTAARPRLTVARSVRLRRLLRGLPVVLACDAPCTERVLLLVDRKTAKRLGLRGAARGGRVVVGSARAALTRAGTGAVTAKLTRANARRLRSLRPRSLRLGVGLERAGTAVRAVTVKR